MNVLFCHHFTPLMYRSDIIELNQKNKQKKTTIEETIVLIMHKNIIIIYGLIVTGELEYKQLVFNKVQ